MAAIDPSLSSAELYRLLVESVDDYAIFALDPQGYIISWNPGAQRFKGYTAAEAIGQHFSIFYPPEKIASHFPEYELREAARLGRFENEGWRVRKDGSRFWANVVITALRDPAGQLIGFGKFTRDLTERKAAEESLRISEERFRLLVSGVKDYAIYMLDPHGIVATWNEGAERIKGYTAQEIIGHSFSTFYVDEDIASGKPARELEIASATGRYEEEGWRKRKDGTRFWASVLLSAIHNTDGHLIGFAKVTRDLTERRKATERTLEDARRVAAEEAARQAADSARLRAERLQVVTGALSAARTIAEIGRTVIVDGLATLGMDAGVLAIFDPAAGRIAVVAAAGVGVLPLPLRDVPLGAQLPVSEVIRTGTPVICRSRADRDARFPELRELLRNYDATVVAPLIIRGQTMGAIATHLRDGASLTEETITFMFAAAQQVAQALDRARLYEAEMQARARADEANRAKAQFLAAMSHELRTPLNAIAGYAELMDLGIRGPVTEQQHEDLRRIKRSQGHLLGIINDILNFARVEAGQVSYQIRTVALGPLLDAVAQMIGPQAAAKGLRLNVETCSAVVSGDAAKIEQIVLNLLSNAVKFTSAGEVSVACHWQGPDRVEVIVRDTGDGIAPEELERIFEPFVQVGRSLTASHEGTGLGLAISRDLARAMGGDIVAESTLGLGSIFRLTLPKEAGAMRLQDAPAT